MTISGVTSNGSLWMVSPAAVARRAIGASRSRATLGKTDVGQRNWQTHLGWKSPALLPWSNGSSFKNQLYQETEGDLFAVEEGMGFRHGGQAVVNGMSRCKPDDSKPMPDSRVLASTRRSSAGVTA